MDFGTFLMRILLCLIASAILGGIIGWFLKKLTCGSRIAELEASLGSRDSELAGLRASLSKSNSDADAENTKDDAEIASLKKKISSLEADLNASRDKAVALEADLKAKAAVPAGVSEEVHAKLKTDYETLEAKLSSTEGELKTKVAALAALPAAAASTGVSEDVHAKLQADYDRLKIRFDEAEGEKAFLLERVKKAEAGETVKRRPPESEWDDLEQVYGIGPVLERMLYDMGIYTFKEIAQWDAAKIAEIDAALPQFKGRIEREGWIASAKEEHFKKYGEKL